MCRFIQRLIFWLVFPNLLWGASYYVDPVNGDMGNPGTVEHPWKTLEAVLSRKKVFDAGDTIFLRSGYHGAIHMALLCPLSSKIQESMLYKKRTPD